MKIVLTYGTFDLFHVGHTNILKRAKALGDKLYVGVTGEVYDKERGKLEVIDSLETRLNNVKNSGYVDEVFVEEYLGQKISDIKKYNADILVVGADWKGKFDHLNEYCKVVYLPRTKNISSTKIRKATLHNVGLITDKENTDLFYELHFLSTFNPQGVFLKNTKISNEIGKNYDTNVYNSFNDFVKQIETVYFDTNDNKTQDIKKFLKNGKNVITKSITTSNEKIKELFAIAKNNGVKYLECVPLVYSRNFDQLIWMTNEDDIGEIKCIEIVGKMTPSFVEELKSQLVVIYKIIGDKFTRINTNHFKNKQTEYADVVMSNKKTTVLMKVVNNDFWKEKLVITGTKGIIKCSKNWKDLLYFNVNYFNNREKRRFSYDSKGSSLRNVLLELKNQLSDSKYKTTGWDVKDSIKVNNLLNAILNSEKK